MHGSLAPDAEARSGGVGRDRACCWPRSSQATRSGRRSRRCSSPAAGARSHSLGRAPLPGGGAVLLGAPARARRPGPGSPSRGRSRPTVRGTSSTGRSSSSAFLVVGLLLGACGPRACRWAAAGSRRCARGSGRLGARRQGDPGALPRRRSDRAPARSRSATGTRSRSPPTCCSCWALWLAASAGRARPSRAARCSSTRRSWRCCWRRRAPALLPRCSALRSGSGLARPGRRRAARARRRRPGVGPRGLGVQPSGARRRRLPACRARRRRCWFGLLLLAGGVRGRARRARAETAAPLPGCRRIAARVLAGLAVVAAPRRRGRRGRARGQDRRRVPRRRGHEQPRSAPQLQLEQPPRVVGRGLGHLQGRPGRRVRGPNTFEVARKRYRETASPVTQPHSVPLQFLAGTGSSAWRSSLRWWPPRRPLRSARCGGSRAASGTPRRRWPCARRSGSLHALVDYDWDFVAVTGPVLFAAGALAAAGRPARHSARPLAALAAAARGGRRGRVGRSRPGSPTEASATSGPRLDRGDLAAAADLPRGRGRSTRCPSSRSSRAPASRRRGATTRRRSPTTAGGAAPAREPGDAGTARPLRVRPRRPLLGVRAPEPGVHARSGGPAVGARRSARPARAWVNDGELLSVAADDERDVRAEQIRARVARRAGRRSSASGPRRAAPPPAR